MQGRQCANVAIGDQIEFFAKVSLNECKSGGDIAVSIGAYGYQTVSALYITPSCGCECEKMQNQVVKRSLVIKIFFFPKFNSNLRAVLKFCILNAFCRMMKCIAATNKFCKISFNENKSDAFCLQIEYSLIFHL